MPKLTVEGLPPAEVTRGTRLVNAIEGLGVDIGHRCGGKARCTTCRVHFLEGEPHDMTRAEYDKLSAEGLLDQVRLSCQIVLDHDMSVRPLMRARDQGWPDLGPRPADTVEPDPERIARDALEG